MLSSAGLKYELIPRPSRWRGVWLACSYSLLALLLVLLAPPLPWFQGLLVLVVTGLGWRQWRWPPMPLARLWFDELGQLSWENEGQGALQAASLVTPWCCLLRVRIGGHRSDWWAVYRDQLDEADFRRLARTLYRVRRAGVGESD